jgi:hypothetical protein
MGDIIATIGGGLDRVSAVRGHSIKALKRARAALRPQRCFVCPLGIRLQMTAGDMHPTESV